MTNSDFTASSASSASSFPAWWQYFLHNLGEWSGSFTQISPQGEIQQDLPSLVTIKALNNHQAAELTLQQFSPETQAEIKRLGLNFSSSNQTIPFFETGAFCQGSTQFSLAGQFGTEMGFIWGDRRLRLVQLFTAGQLAKLTLIRERQTGKPPREVEPTKAAPRQAQLQAEQLTGKLTERLTVEQLLGDWQGEAVTLDTDGQEIDRMKTRLVIQRSGDRLQQTLTMPGFELSSAAEIQDHVLHFSQGKLPMQVLLLPGGVSSNTPLTISQGQPFLLEAGWLIEPDLRQRMIRRYRDNGEFVSLTLVTERLQKNSFSETID